jgi:hypothetical protein
VTPFRVGQPIEPKAPPPVPADAELPRLREVLAPDWPERIRQIIGWSSELALGRSIW